MKLTNNQLAILTVINGQPYYNGKDFVDYQFLYHEKRAATNLAKKGYLKPLTKNTFKLTLKGRYAIAHNSLFNREE